MPWAAVSHTYHRSGAVSDLLVLQVSQFTQDLSSWVLHFQQLQDGCSIVGDGHVLQKEFRTHKLLSPSYCFVSKLSVNTEWQYKIQLNTLTPMSSTNILSRPTGPRELLTMLAMDDAAMTEQKKKKTLSHLSSLTNYLYSIRLLCNNIFCQLIKWGAQLGCHTFRTMTVFVLPH